jgi:hypothetical protein
VFSVFSLRSSGGGAIARNGRINSRTDRRFDRALQTGLRRLDGCGVGSGLLRSGIVSRILDLAASPLARARTHVRPRSTSPPRARLRARVSSHRVVVVVDSERHASSRGPRFRRRRRPRIRRQVARRPRRLRRPRRPRRPRRLRRGTSRHRRRCASASRRVRRRAIRARRDRLAPRPSRVAIPIRSWVFFRAARAGWRRWTMIDRSIFLLHRFDPPPPPPSSSSSSSSSSPPRSRECSPSYSPTLAANRGRDVPARVRGRGGVQAH